MLIGIDIDEKSYKAIKNHNIDYYDALNGLTAIENGRILDNQSKHDEAIHAQGFVDGVKACIEKLNEMGADK